MYTKINKQFFKDFKLISEILLLIKHKVEQF